MSQQWNEFEEFRDCVDAAFKQCPNVRSAIPFRSKGASAVVINEQGSGIHGTAEGYLDLLVDNRGDYKEKIATFVIRNFMSAQPINELT